MEKLNNYYILDEIHRIVEESGLQFLNEAPSSGTILTVRDKIETLLLGKAGNIPGIRNMHAFKSGQKIIFLVLGHEGDLIWMITVDYYNRTIKYFNRMGKQIFNLNKKSYIDYD